MIAAFVADASVAIGWVHPEQANHDSEAMLDAIAAGATLEVPALWPLEVANALTVLARRRRVSGAERRTALHFLGALRLRIDPEGTQLAFNRLADLADAYGLSVYDACYLELAQRRDLILGTNDSALRRAARQCNIQLWR